MLAVRQATIDSPWGGKRIDLSKKNLSVQERHYLVNVAKSKIFPATDLTEYFHLNVNTLRQWIQRLKKGKQLKENVGAPRKIDSPDLVIAVKDVIKNAKSKVRVENENSLFIKAQSLTEAKKINAEIAAPPSEKLDVHPRTIRRYKKELNVVTKLAEIGTKARATATACIYNCFTFAVMAYALWKIWTVSSFLVFNPDGTVYTVGGNGGDKVQVLVVRSSREINGKPVLTTKEARKEAADLKKKKKLEKAAATAAALIRKEADRKRKFLEPKQELKAEEENSKKATGFIKYSIKHYACISAQGKLLDPIFIFADENMGPEEIDIHEVPGLGAGTQLDGIGYIIFTKTRATNLAFYLWFLEKYFIPRVDMVRKHENLGATALAVLMEDGEATQIECLKDEMVLKLLASNNIKVLKPPASTSSITQPCDVYNLFKAIKTYLKHLNDSQATENQPMQKRIEGFFNLHNDFLNDEELRGATNLQFSKLPKARKPSKRRRATPAQAASSGSSSSRKPKQPRKVKEKAPPRFQFNPSHRKMAVNGLLRVLLTIQEVVRPRIILDSWRRTGLYPFNIDQMISMVKCSALDQEQRTIFKNGVPALAQLFVNQGELFTSDIVAIGLKPTVNRKKPIDALVPYRRRSIELTNPFFITREKFLLVDGDANEDDDDEAEVAEEDQEDVVRVLELEEEEEPRPKRTKRATSK